MTCNDDGGDVMEGSAVDDSLLPGMVPTVPLSQACSGVHINLVTSTSDMNLIVGSEFVVAGVVIAAWKFPQHLDLRGMSYDDVEASCYQISGHVSNDGKQINILSGQASCSVGFPMPCCMVSKKNLGQPPEWLMRMFLRHAITAAARIGANELPDYVIDIIGAMAGLPVLRDADRRTGEKCFVKTNLLWQDLTKKGKFKLQGEAYKKANERVGSSFNVPIIAVPCEKENGGILHTPAGNNNHFWQSVGKEIKKKMKGCPWQIRLGAIDEELSLEIKKVEGKLKELRSCSKSNEINSRIRRIRREKKRETDEDRIRVLGSEEEAANKELRELSETTAIGSYNLILAGLKEFEVVLKTRPKGDSKRPESDLQFVLWKAIETRAGGRLDLKQSGLDQTNSAGLVSLENCSRVFDALLGMYPPTTDIHEWLKVKVVNWERLGKSLYDVGIFLKSQRKRSPVLLDRKLLRLWGCWEDAFPGKSFNKFHGIFCTVRNYVHLYHMAGRVSEESNEAYNGTLDDTKSTLRCMPSHTKRIDKVTERSQANLKGEVLESRLVIQNAKKSRKSGPRRPRALNHDGRVVRIVTDKYIEVDGESYVVLSSENLLVKKWVDIFAWFAGGRAPQDWIDRFNSTAPDAYTDVDRAKEKNSMLV